MTMKEYMETYLQIMENRRKDLAFRLNQTAREACGDTQAMIYRDGRRARSLAQYAMDAVEKEARLEVYEEVIKEISDFLKAVEEGKVE